MLGEALILIAFLFIMFCFLYVCALKRLGDNGWRTTDRIPMFNP
jgi:hypothetical protein